MRCFLAGRLPVFFLIVLILLNANLKAQIISTFAGMGITGTLADSVSATVAQIGLPCGGAFDNHGNYYFSEAISRPIIRVVNTSGFIYTVAGNGIAGFAGDGGPATAAKLNYPVYATVDFRANIFIADLHNARVRRVDGVTHIITTYGGNGTRTSSGDGGAATDATLVPENLCVDGSGNVYILDSAFRVRRIDTFGIITTIAGTGISGFTGDGGPATAARIAESYGICTDTAGNVYIGCYGRVRKVDKATGIITTVAGNGNQLCNGDHANADSAQFDPYCITTDASGNLYIGTVSSLCERVFKVDVATHSFVTVAGIGTCGFSGDGGPATAAQICNPEGLVVDACGNLYIADDNNHRIRKVDFHSPPNISISGITNASVGGVVTVSASLGAVGIGYSIRWMNRGVEFATTTVPSVTYTKTMTVDSITAKVFGCSDSAVSNLHVVTDSTAAIPERQRQEAFSVGPNPVQNTLVITSVAPVIAASIINAMGQTVLSKEYHETNITINMSGCSPGVYLLKIEDTEGRKHVQQIIKQ